MEGEAGEADARPLGVLGDGALRAGKYNMRLVRRAILNGWPVTDEIKQAVVAQMHVIVEAGDPREQVAAAKVLVAADALNAKREATEAEQSRPASPGTVINQVNLNGLSVDELRNLRDTIRRIQPAAEPGVGD